MRNDIIRGEINFLFLLPPLQARVMKTGEMVALKIIKIEPGKRFW